MVINFTEFVLSLKLLFFAVLWEKFCSWDMFSANQIAGFFNQPYLEDKSVQLPDFSHVDTNWHKLKVDQNICGWAWPEWVWLILSWHSKIDCISRTQECTVGMTWFFACWCYFRKAESYFSDFWVDLVKNGHSHLVHETLKPAVS